MATHKTYAPLDWNGAETSSLVHSWPVRNEPHSKLVKKQREWIPPYESASQSYGFKVRCNSSQPFLQNVNIPVVAAGRSDRVGCFYQKHGTLAHRTEPNYREHKGTCGRVEPKDRAGRNLACWRSLTYPRSNASTCSTVRTERSEKLGQVEHKPGYNFDPLPMYKTTHYDDYKSMGNYPKYPSGQDAARDYHYHGNPPAAGRYSAW